MNDRCWCNHFNCFLLFFFLFHAIIFLINLGRYFNWCFPVTLLNVVYNSIKTFDYVFSSGLERRSWNLAIKGYSEWTAIYYRRYFIVPIELSIVNIFFNKLILVIAESLNRNFFLISTSILQSKLNIRFL